MEKGPRYHLEIGVGGAERIIREAKKHSDRHYVVVDLNEPEDTEQLPDNVSWFFGGITKERGIQIPDGMIDEVSMDYVLGSIYGDEGYEESIGRILQEAVRVLKEDGQIILREPKYMVGNIVPILEKLDLRHKASPMLLKEARLYGESIGEIAHEFEDGYLEMEPYIIIAKKRKDS